MKLKGTFPPYRRLNVLNLFRQNMIYSKCIGEQYSSDKSTSPGRSLIRKIWSLCVKPWQGPLPTDKNVDDNDRQIMPDLKCIRQVN